MPAKDSSEFNISSWIISSLSNPIIWMNLEGKILECTHSTLALLNLESVQLIGKTYQEMGKLLKWPAKEIDKLITMRERTISVGKLQKHSMMLTDPSTPLKKLHYQIKHDPVIIQGKLKGVMAEFIMTEELERKIVNLRQKYKKIDKARQSEIAELDRIIANLPSNVYWVDKNSANLGCNNNLVKTLGLKTRSEVKGLTYEDMATLRNWPIEEARSWRKDDLEVLRTGLPKHNITNSYGAIDGKQIGQLTSRVPLFDEKGNISGVIGLATDITAQIEKEIGLREAKEKAEIANQAKSDFVATISHELRTPLGGILGMANILSQQKITKKQQVFVSDIISAGNSLLSLINDILDHAKLEAGELNIDSRPFNLQDVIEDVVKQISSQAKEKKLKLITNIAVDAQLDLIGDSQKLGQILVNIMGNSVKYTEKGRIQLSVEVLSKSNKYVELAFIIEDTGIGISKHNISKIFDRFSQLDPSYNKRHKGTGLGLSIVNRLLELIQGTIEVESELGKGSKFTVKLRFATKLVKADLNKWQREFSDIRILIIDEDLNTAGKILRHIKTPKTELASTKTAINALENAAKRNQHYPIILIGEGLKYNDDMVMLDKLKHKFRSLHNPMVIYCQDPESKDIAILDNTIVFKALNSDLSSEQFSSKLAEYWINYQEKLESHAHNLKSLKPKLLIVEDNVINQRVLSEMLSALGCQFDIADNAIMAHEKFDKGKYKLILMDVGLPDTDGYVLTQQIREKEKMCSNDNAPVHIPIVGVTAYASNQDKQKCLDSGMDDVMTKPINQKLLQITLMNWLL